MPLPHPSTIRALSFDCYGTLIDWQHGILTLARPILSGRVRPIGDQEVIARFAALEREAEKPPYRSYRQVLESVGNELLGEDSGYLLWHSIAHWPAFPDTAAALARLQTRFKLAITSNIDDALFAFSKPRLGIEPDCVVTAQQVRSYKPGRAHFDALVERLGLQPRQILHVAESRFHDIEPASQLGFPTVWVRRVAAGPSASGAATMAGVEPDLTVSSLAELAPLLLDGARS